MIHTSQCLANPGKTIGGTNRHEATNHLAPAENECLNKQTLASANPNGTFLGEELAPALDFLNRTALAITP